MTSWFFFTTEFREVYNKIESRRIHETFDQFICCSLPCPFLLFSHFKVCGWHCFNTFYKLYRKFLCQTLEIYYIGCQVVIFLVGLVIHAEQVCYKLLRLPSGHSLTKFVFLGEFSFRFSEGIGKFFWVNVCLVFHLFYLQSRRVTCLLLMCFFLFWSVKYFSIIIYNSNIVVLCMGYLVLYWNLIVFSLYFLWSYWIIQTFLNIVI